MNKSLGAVAALLLSLTLVAGAEAQDPQPPWSVKFSHKPLDVITVPFKDGSATSYYYMLFTLKNEGARDAKLGLHFRATVGSDPRKQKVHLALPAKAAEEYVRRMSRAPGLKNLQQINALGTLKKGKSVQGIAVFGTFHREWDTAVVTVSGLEPHGLQCRVRKFEGAGFTLAHRAYLRHNKAIMAKVGEDAEYSEAHAIIRHEVLWVMKYHREGDEYSPQLDPIILDGEGWDVAAKPTPEIVVELELPFKKK